MVLMVQPVHLVQAELKVLVAHLEVVVHREVVV